MNASGSPPYFFSRVVSARNPSCGGGFVQYKNLHKKDYSVDHSLSAIPTTVGDTTAHASAMAPIAIRYQIII